VQTTIGDAGNIIIFANARDFDIRGHETAAYFTGNAEIFAQMKELRGKGAQILGMGRR
jgi:2-methylaconitate cis-trans-isomerase PrpF